MKKTTLKKQITGMVVLTVVLMVTLVFFLNTVFLSRFYLFRKENNLDTVFNTIASKTGEDSLYSEEDYNAISLLSKRYNIAFLVMEPNGNVILSSESNTRSLVSHLFTTAFSGDNGSIITRENYSVKRILDNEQGSEYLVLWGNLSDGNTIFMETAMSSIADSIAISNSFLVIAGLVAIIAGLCVSAFITARMLKPLNELTDIAGSMSNLDFDVKYVPNNHLNEIDYLGLKMNKMSLLIEENIKNLKQVNLDLLADIRIKEKNDEMRKAFLSNLSHELKTPISLIYGYADGLLDENIANTPEKKLHYASMIEKEADRMDTLIARLLELNELEYGQQQAKLSRVNLKEILNDVINSVLILAKNADVKIESNITSNNMVWTDEFLARIVLENYLTNAIKYSTGSKIVEISDRKEPDKIIIFVKNTCEPIPESELDKIWDIFYRVDKARSREQNSNGIGLSVVKACANILGSDCGVSNVSDGVEFYFTFDAKV